MAEIIDRVQNFEQDGKWRNENQLVEWEGGNAVRVCYYVLGENKDKNIFRQNPLVTPREKLNELIDMARDKGIL